jgi:hypothetical protein
MSDRIARLEASLAFVRSEFWPDSLADVRDEADAELVRKITAERGEE